MTGSFAGKPPRARRAVALLAAGSLAFVSAAGGLPPRAAAQPVPAATGVEVQRLGPAELEQLLAPIALYPDQLLMQVLMASTYPLEVVQAQRWLGQGQNAKLGGAALEKALVAQPWDPAVKSLVPFPQVLALMNEQLDWTQRLGDAVLGQQAEVLDSVQVLRGRALAAGKLADGPQQVVTRSATVGDQTGGGQPPVIVIQPAQPQQVYVPVYDPSVVYGPWPYAAHPPAYYPPPPAYGVGDALLTGMAFATGVAVVGSLWGWASPGWGYGRGRVDVDVNRYNNINVNRTQINNNTWVHDGAHRGGVPYRDRSLNDRYRQEGNGNRPDSREALRDRTRQVNRGGPEAARSGTRPSQPRRPDAARPANRASDQDRAGAVNRPQARPEGRPAARPEARPQTDHARQDRQRAPRQERAAPTRDRMPAAEARPVSRQHHGGGRGEARAARSGGGGALLRER